MQLPRPWQSMRPTRSVRDLSVETKVCKTKHAPNQNMMTSLQKKTLWESVSMIFLMNSSGFVQICSNLPDVQRISKGFLDVPGIPWSCTPLSPPLGLRAYHEVTRHRRLSELSEKLVWH